MTIQFIIVLIGIAILIAFAWYKLSKRKTLYPLMSLKYDFGLRRNTFVETLKLLEQRKGKLIVETGTSRDGLKNTKGDGAATIVFGQWAKNNQGQVISVDISQDSIDGSKEGIQEQKLDDFVTLHLSDSIAFLEEFDRPIDLLYLDSYDYSLHDEEIQRKSQEHHLKEYMAVKDKLHPNSIILIDDCDLPGGGKGKVVVEHMLKDNWVILKEAYQILLVKKESLLKN